MEQMIKVDQKLDSKADASIVANLEECLDGLLDVTQQRVETKVDSVVTTLNNNATMVQECVEGGLKLQLLEEKSEEAAKNRRKTSVIVHGIQESTEADSEQQIKDDGDVMQEILHHIKCDEVNVSQIIHPSGQTSRRTRHETETNQDGAGVRSIKRQNTQMCKKLEEQTGGRPESYIHPPGPNTQVATSKEDTGDGAQRLDGKRREKPHNSEWKNCTEKKRPETDRGQSCEMFL